MMEMEKEERVDGRLNFTNEFYSTPLGTFALSQAILNGAVSTEKDREMFRTRYWRLKRDKRFLKRMDIRKRDCLERICGRLGLTLKTKDACIVISRYNIIFTFCLEDENGKPTAMPIREDGYMPITLCEGKVYTLDEWLSEEDADDQQGD